MNMRQKHWANIEEVGFVAGMRLLFWVYRVLGRWPFRLVLHPVLFWYVATRPLPRHASQHYLQRVSRFTDVDLGWMGAIRHFRSFAETLLDKMLLWGGLYKMDNVQCHGVADIDRMIAERRGALLICSHLGNLELCRVLSRRHAAMRLTILVHTKHARAFNRMLARLNPESSLDLVQVTDMTPHTAMLLAKRVEAGEFVVIAGDRVPVSANPQIVMTDFLGDQAAFPIGPYVLASALACPIYLLFSIQCDGRTEVHFELLREIVKLPRKERDKALRPLVADYAARLQHYCLRAPLQWFNFYDFWHLPRLESTDAPR